MVTIIKILGYIGGALFLFWFVTRIVSNAIWLVILKKQEREFNEEIARMALRDILEQMREDGMNEHQEP